MILSSIRIESSSEEQTESLGRRLGACIRVGDAVLLSGELGAGKTCMARGIAAGAECGISARSPTFIIVAEYPGRVTIFHCDLYRVASDIEMHELALLENLDRGALVVEWPENGADSLPQDSLTVKIETRAPIRDARRIEFSANGTRASHLLSRFEQTVHQDVYA